MIYTPLTKAAMRLAFDAHRDQLDKSGLPYIYHPVHLAEQMDDQYATCVALLHDVVEDTRYTIDDLRAAGFPQVVLDAVALMTHDDSVPYMDYIYQIKSNPLAKKVKLADLRHNCDLSRLDIVTQHDLDRVEKYKKSIELLENEDNPNVTMLHQTLGICRRGNYILDGAQVNLKTSLLQRVAAVVYLPDELEKLELNKPSLYNRHAVSCCGSDSFTAAREIYSDPAFDPKKDRILVLNFANPVNRGGGVRRGAKAQEEDLCRQSSLLLSLESKSADAYYDYNRSLHTFMGSDAIIESPYVEIIRDFDGRLLDSTAVVSVMTCAAPYIINGLEGMDETGYYKMIRKRIHNMLAFAAARGYSHLVLGAWGCGAFGNDPAVVAQAFYDELYTATKINVPFAEFFDLILFAVYSKAGDSYNLKVFRHFFQR